MIHFPEQYRLQAGEVPGLARTWHYSEKGMMLLVNSYQGMPKEAGGFFVLPNAKTKKGKFFWCLCSTGQGWNHISVSIPTEQRCPTWEEMCFVKDLFFEPEDCVVQYHPPKSDYISNHPFCLHLWQPNEGQELPRPPKILVGI